MKQRIFCALMSAIMGTFVLIALSACSEKYGEDDRFIPAPATPTPDPTPEEPMPVTFNRAMSFTADVLADTTVYETILGVYSNDSLVTRELRWEIAPELTGPSYLVVKDSLPTVNCGYDRPQTTEGAWQVTASGDSVRTSSTSSAYKFSYYEISVETHNTVGYTDFSGLWEPYLEVSILTSLNSFKSEWLGEIEREDSLFQRELTTQIFLVYARSEYSHGSFYLSKEVVIDHFIKVKEEEVEEEPEPETPPTTVVTSDYWTPGLINLMYGFRVYREDTHNWVDAYPFRTESGYFILVANFVVKNGKEQFVSFETQTVSKTVCPWTNAYNGVIFHDGKFYPAVATPVDGKWEKGWNLVATISGSKVTKSVDANSAVKQGLKNFQGDNTAYPTPVIPTTTDVKTVDGKVLIDFIGKTSVHTVGKIVADASLKK